MCSPTPKMQDEFVDKWPLQMILISLTLQQCAPKYRKDSL